MYDISHSFSHPLLPGTYGRKVWQSILYRGLFPQHLSVTCRRILDSCAFDSGSLQYVESLYDPALKSRSIACPRRSDSAIVVSESLGSQVASIHP